MISCKSSSVCKISFMRCCKSAYSGSNFVKKGSRTRMYFEKEIFQLIDGKCFLCASFLSKPQNTWTILNVADVTGSVKSPPGGDTAPTIVIEPSLFGFPAQVTRPLLS